MAYSFFFSYARADVDDEKRITRFFEILNQQVKLRGLPPGFIDVLEIDPGKIWYKVAAEAAQAPVLVSMYSPNYFRSQYCGQEIQMFQERRRAFLRDPKNHGLKAPYTIIPVWWQRSTYFPKTLPKYNHISPSRCDPAVKPAQDGFQYLMFVDKSYQGEVLRDSIYALADDIQRIIDPLPPDVPPTPLPAVDHTPLMSLPSAFEPWLPLAAYDDPRRSLCGPDTVTFIYAASQRGKWPFLPPRARCALNAASAIALANEFEPHQLVFDPARDDLSKILPDIRRRNNPAVLLIDGVALSDPQLQDALRAFDGHAPDGSSVMILWPEGKSSDGGLAKKFFPLLSGASGLHYHDSLGSIAGLEAAIGKTLFALQANLQNRPQQPNPVPEVAVFPHRPQISAVADEHTESRAA
jgi:hypothetical protein